MQNLVRKEKVRQKIIFSYGISGQFPRCKMPPEKFFSQSETSLPIANVPRSISREENSRSPRPQDFCIAPLDNTMRKQ